MKNIIIAISALILSSCTAPIDIKTNNTPPVIVIMGQVTDVLANQEVRITSSLPYFDTNRAQGISDAVVTITASSGAVFNLTESTTEAGLYISDNQFVGISNETYTLKVIVDFDADGKLEEYEAKSTMIPQIPVDKIEMNPETINGMKLYHVSLFAPAPIGESYFRARFLVNGETVLTRLSEWVIMDNRILKEEYLDGISIYQFFDVSEKSKFSDSDVKDMVFLTAGDEVTLLFSQIDKPYFDFIDQSQSAIRGENPLFGGPASNIITNISGGAIGFFSTLSSSTLIATVP